ncbi:MAG TPA: hypothetical protein VNM37_07240, partial [Candidatus Dormibacteraeota bacterium]|nr:hypothetical protein [Candidatus Dormibacteraeota bacterium]
MQFDQRLIGFALPIKLTHTADDRRDILGGSFDGPQEAQSASRNIRFALGEEVGKAKHRRQGVVDVVGDAAG